MTQYAIVWRPDLTHVVRAIGPFRKLETALAISNEFDALEESLDIVAGYNDDEMSLIPEVVRLEDWPSTKAELIAKYGEADPIS